MLRRLGRIAEERIDAGSVAAYFAKACGIPARLESFEIGGCGNISNRPEYFFGDDMNDIPLQAEAAMRKRLQQISSARDESSSIIRFFEFPKVCAGRSGAH